LVLVQFLSPPVVRAQSAAGAPLSSSLLPLSGLVSWWAAEGSAADSIGANPGTLQGGAGFSGGEVGQAFSLDGVSQFVRVPNSPSLNPSGSFSIAAWIYLTSNNGIATIINKWADSPAWSNQRSYTFHVNSGGVLVFSISDAANQGNTTLHDFVTTNNAVPLNAWTHVAAVYDQSTGTRRMFVNGVNITNRTDAPLTVLNGIADVSIGAVLNAPGSPQWFFAGMLDELAFYSRALSDSEIAAIYNAGGAPPVASCSPPASGLVSWWKAEGNGSDLINSNNGALLNGAVFSAGKVGQAFNLTGGAHVRIKDEPNLRFTTGLTIETWVSPASGGTDHQIVSKWDAIVGINQRCYGLSIWEDNRAYLGISTDGLHLSGTTTNVFSVNTVPMGQWTHIAATYDGTALKIYLNGVLENTAPLSGSIFPGTNDLAIGGVVGGLGFSDFILPFDGLVDEVSLYNRALTSGEIQAIYNAGSAGKCVGPIAQCSPPPSGIISFWPAEGNPQDLVGGNGGVSLSGATFSAGKVGQAFSFNGSGAHVRVKDASNLHVTTNFSLESWFFRQGTGPAIQSILDKWDAAPGFNQRSYGISLHDNLATFGGSSDGVNADGVIQSTTAIPTNQWIHMVGTYDGATMKLYLNGVLNNSAGFIKGFFPGTNDFAIGGEVGGLSPGSAISTFQGLIDEPTIYSRALSSNEVLAIFTAGAGGKCPVPAPPVITSQPAGRTVPAGTNATFSVAVIGATPLNYQWRYNGSNILGATNVSLTLSNVQLSASGNYSVFVSNSAGSTNSSNAVLTVNGGSSSTIWAVNFFADKNPGLGTVKHGLAAIGHTTNDVWNGCSRDGIDMFDFLTFVVVSNLITVDGVTTGVGLTLTNAPGAWFNGTDDAMYNTYLYPFDGNNLVVEVTNLPAGAYDFYVYGHGNVDQGGFHDLNGVYQLSVGSADYGTRSTATSGTNWMTTNWTEGEQYVVFRGVTVGGGQKVVLTGLPGVGGEALIAGLQILASGAPVAIAPVITNQPTSQTVAVGANVNFSVGVTGTTPLSYLWKFNGTNLNGQTNASLILSNVQLSAAGNYSVFVSNSVGSTNSSNAVLTVNPPCLAPPAGIVSWWPGEGNANDLIGGNAGVLFNGASFSAGKVGQAFSFDGINDHIRIKDAPNLRFTTSMTVEAWIFPTSLGADQGIITKWDAAPGFNQRSYGISIVPNGTIGFGSSPNGINDGGKCFTTNAVPTNLWTFVVGTYDGVFLRVYVNGVLNNSVAYNGGTFPGTGDLAIGGEVGGLPNGSTIAPFSGLIDEPTVYNRALSSSEVLAIYNTGASGKCQAPAPPLITSQPASQTVPPVANVSFNVGVIGATPFTYQWKFNGTNINGGTNSSLTLSNVQVSQSGNYSVFVSNSGGSTNSSNAVLTVSPTASTCQPPPSGLVAWWAAEGNANDNFGFNHGTLKNGATTAAGEVGQSFSLNGGNQYVEVPPASVLNPPGSFTLEAWIFPLAQNINRSIIGKWSDAGDYLDSRSFIMTVTAVNALGFGISDAAHQADTSFHTFDTTNNAIQTNVWSHVAAVYDQATGVRRTYINGVNVASRTNPPITVLNANTKLSIGARMSSSTQAVDFFAGKIDEATMYQRALSGAEIQAIFNAGISGKCPAAPVIVSQPQGQAVFAGLSASFSVVANGTPPLGYQWRLNGTNLGGATNSSLTLSNVQASQTGNYSVFVTSAGGSTNSTNALLSVLAPGDCVPAPANAVSWWAAEGNAIDAVGSNNGALKNGAGFAPGEVGMAFNLNGVNQYVEVPPSPAFNPPGSFTLETWVYPLSPSSNRVIIGKWADFGDYPASRCFILTVTGVNALGFGISDAAHQTDGTFHTFDTPSNTVPLNAWSHVAAVYDQSTGTRRTYINGVKMATRTDVPITVLTANTKLAIGATMATSTSAEAFFAGKIDEATIYQRALSDAEVLALYMAGATGKCPLATPPLITSQPTNLTVPAGSNATFSVTAIGTPPLNYQWKFNGTNINGRTNSSLTLSNVQSGAAGNYSVLVSNSGNSTNSSNALLTVLPPPSNCVAAPFGVLSWWPGESNADDLVGGNAGTPFNGVAFTAGKVGQAFSLSGFGAHIRVKDAPNLRFGTAMSVEAWINPSAIGGDRAIVSKWDAVPGVDQRSYGMSLRPDGSPVFGVSPDGLSIATEVPGTAPVPANQWTHLAAVYDGTSLRLYVNGVSNNSVAYSGGIYAGIDDLGIGGVVGGTPAGGSIATFAGLIDEPTVYNRALSSNEVLAVYNAGAGGKCQAPAPPSFVSQPVGGTVTAGTNVTFVVAVIGATPLNYQWKLNGSNVLGATNVSLILSNVQLSASGNYSVFVSNSVSSTNSSNAVLTVLPPQTNCTAAPSGIVSWWAAETNANDRIGGNSGTLVNGAGFAAGKVGQAFSLNGTNQYVRIPDHASLSPAGSFSIEGWINVAAINGQAAILSKWGDAGDYGDKRCYTFTVIPGNALQFGISDAARQGDTSFHLFNSTSNLIVPNTWMHVAAVYDQSTGTRRLYVNGTNFAARTDAPITVLNANNDASIGARLSSSTLPVALFQGMIDELTFYNRALNSGEIAAIYSAGTSGKCLPTIPLVTSLVVVETVAAGVVSLPVNLLGTGNENSLGFSLNFNASLLNFTGAVLGNGTPAGASLVINTNLLAGGKVGIGVGLPANATFGPGTRELVKLNFLVTSQSNTTTIPVTFGDQPATRQVSDVLAHPITATYTNGSVTLPFFGVEGDVAQRTNGDGTVTITDWVQVGRFVAGLDTAVNSPNEFQRADCAPRSTLGDGQLTVADWVQAGRYAVGLDPLTSAGGPISAGALFNPASAGNTADAGGGRTITAVGGAAQAGQVLTVPVQLNSLGNESAVGFSVTFDRAVLTFNGADLGSGAAGATLNVNSDGGGNGVVGIALSLPIGSTFASAVQELARLNFTVAPAAAGNTTVSFANQPVVQAVADATAETLAASYVNATVTVSPVVIVTGPTLNISKPGDNLLITWPASATGFSLESTDDPASGVWTPVNATTITNGMDIIATVPASAARQFFRLHHPD
jgi:hypothetical protein